MLRPFTAMALAIAAFLVVPFGTAQAESDLVKRGSYLVNGIMTCGNCHTPKGPNGDIADKAFSGGLSWDEPPFKVTAPNITQDKETGIGSWTDADIKKLLRSGVTPKGVHIAMVMPTGFYHAMTERDVDSIVAYLRTVKPISNKVADPVYKMPQVEVVLPGAEKPLVESDIRGKLKKGQYLVTIAHCMECHTPMGPKGRDFSRMGTGGFEMTGPWGTSVSRNITQSKAKGIGGWTDAEIKRAITQGISRDGSHLKPPMGFANYATLTPEDLDAVLAYLRTVPAKE
jgi:mono/diheme cytochrome c family protein